MRWTSVKRRIMPRRGVAGLPLLGVMFCLAMGFISCESIYDDNSDCRLGVSLRFTFDYHMEPGANAFMSNVDCVTVYVFDSAGNYHTKLTEERRELLRDENYRMELPLAEGDWHLVVYGGTTCEDRTFELTPDFESAGRAGATQADIRVTLPLDAAGQSAKQLHKRALQADGTTIPVGGGLFYGTKEIRLTDADYARTYREETVNLMKDTNTIQILLQELNGTTTLDVDDYDFKIIDENGILDGYNNAVEGSAVIYRPYYTHNEIMGYVQTGNRDGDPAEQDPERPVQVGIAELSTSRLLYEHIDKAVLLVSSTKEKDDKTGEYKEIIRLPLIQYLAQTRGYGNNWIKTPQEYLDRQSNWELMFFLQRNAWVRTRIAVNWWTVRINDIELGW